MSHQKALKAERTARENEIAYRLAAAIKEYEYEVGSFVKTAFNKGHAFFSLVYEQDGSVYQVEVKELFSPWRIIPKEEDAP